jgi:hypothetical protein
MFSSLAGSLELAVVTNIKVHRFLARQVDFTAIESPNAVFCLPTFQEYINVGICVEKFQVFDVQQEFLCVSC